MLDKLIHYIKIPLQALYSKEFYLKVLAARGVGFTYLMTLSIVLALPASYKVHEMMQIFKGYELSTYVAQIPPSYVDANGILRPNNPQDTFKVISNSMGEPVMVYNPENKPLEGDLNRVPIELNRQYLTIRTANERTQVAWETIYPTNQSFEPYQSAAAMDRVLDSSIFALWPVVAVYLFASLALGTLVTAVFAMLIFLVFFKLILRYGQCLRLMAYAHTICALILTLQFYVYIPVSYTVMLILPLLYVIVFGRELRNFAMQEVEKVLKRGSEYFRKKAAEAQGQQAGAQGSADASQNAQNNADAEAKSQAEIIEQMRRNVEEQLKALRRQQEEDQQKNGSSRDRGQDNNNRNGSGGAFMA